MRLSLIEGEGVSSQDYSKLVTTTVLDRAYSVHHQVTLESVGEGLCFVSNGLKYLKGRLYTWVFFADERSTEFF
jgi:hypothetical protein